MTFLRHVERTKLLIHLLDISEGPSRDPITDFRTLNNELKVYQISLQERRQILALNKIDLPSVRERATEVQTQFEKIGHRLYLVSGQTGEGIEELIEAVFEALEKVTPDGEGS